jgi:hypothetical protein
MRWRRWLVRIAAGILAAVVLIAGVGWLALRSSFVTSKVAARIEAATGAPVRVGALSLGLRGSSLSGLQFLEDGAPDGAPPWAVIPDVDADLSLAQLARGELSGGTVVLRNAAVTLRLDRDDNLLTRLPTLEGGKMALPAFRLENARIVFQREGRPDSVFTGISAEVRSDPDAFHVNGAADDPNWGKWLLTAERNRDSGETSLRLHSDTVHFTPEKLRSIPFVPAVTWEQVQATGQTPVDMTLRLTATDSAPHYRVVIDPVDMRLHLSAIDLTAEGGHGRVVVEDNIVTLQKLGGRAAGGELAGDARLDFRGEGADMTFDLTATKLALDKLPASWRMPLKTGTMSGKADLRVVVKGGRVETSGEGKGTIEGFLSGPPLQVKMRAEGGGYRFDISNAPGARRAPAPPVPAAALLAAVAVALQPPVTTVPPAAPPQPGKEPAFNDIEINLVRKDVDLAELVQRLGVTVPFKVAGRVTFQVQARIPMNSLNDLKAYRARGTAELPWAKVEDLDLKEVKARVVYEQGVLRLEDLSAGHGAVGPVEC